MPVMKPSSKMSFSVVRPMHQFFLIFGHVANASYGDAANKPL